ncbi:MAG: hypothetical protein GX625_06965 [Clostridiaceae bacterium]|mgnify:CR=1 FL=1|nr:hypothetical protein [Clostridiaceae bacterium]
MILGGTSSYVRVEFNGKIVKIEGELLSNGFLAYRNTIRKWEVPHENEIIDNKTQNLIVEHVLEEAEKANFKIEFE